MKIRIITAFENLRMFLSAANDGEIELQELWQKYMIEPFWQEITQWAPFDQSFKQPPCVKEIELSEKQLAILSKIDVDAMHSEFTGVACALPLADDDDMLVYLYPLCDSDKTVKERQNGVVGTAVFGNVLIRINPLADNYLKWIPFVFAHEYHHNLWGHNWFILRGGQGVEGTFLESMITEGEADLFAESLFPELIPQWNRPFDSQTEKTLWERIKPVLFNTDPEIHAAYMFGDESKGLPWCMGYSFGKMIVTDYMKKHNNLSFSKLLDIPATQIFEKSRFHSYAAILSRKRAEMDSAPTICGKHMICRLTCRGGFYIRPVLRLCSSVFILRHGYSDVGRDDSARRGRRALQKHRKICP